MTVLSQNVVSSLGKAVFRMVVQQNPQVDFHGWLRRRMHTTSLLR